MTKISLVFSAIFLSISSFAATPADVLLGEFNRLEQYIAEQSVDGDVGGLYDYIQMSGYKILFSKEFDGEHDVIRVFKNNPSPQKDFAITYIWSKHLFRGQTVLRRFVGPEPTGWRNDTIDVNTLEYLGRQGGKSPRLSEEEQAIVDEWGIQIEL